MLRKIVIALLVVGMAGSMAFADPPNIPWVGDTQTAEWSGDPIEWKEIWGLTEAGAWEWAGYVGTYLPLLTVNATIYAWIDIYVTNSILTYVIAQGAPGDWVTSPGNYITFWGNCGYYIDITMGGTGHNDPLWPNLVPLTPAGNTHRPVAEWGLDVGYPVAGINWKGVSLVQSYAHGQYGVGWPDGPDYFQNCTLYEGYLYHRIAICEETRVGTYTSTGVIAGLPTL
jgi:hypothetical protein